MNQIETKFYDAFSEILQRGFVIYQDQKINIKNVMDWYNIQLNADELDFQIEPQPDEDLFDGYIPDFVIYVNNLLSGFVIEIDGHEWHEKTKEQAKADKEKDRTYLKKGFIPIRFTGSEVYHNSKRCIDEVFEIIISNYIMFDYENKNIENYLLHEKIENLKKEIYHLQNGFGSVFAIAIKNNTYQLRPSIIEMNQGMERK